MKRQILAIDDSTAIRFLLQTVFSKNFKIITASDGCSAMYWLTKNKLPDLIIADAQLPDMKDWELVEYLKSSGLYGNIPIIVLSAFDKKITQHHCEATGIKDFFLKPFNPVELMKAAERVIANKTKIHENPLKLV